MELDNSTERRKTDFCVNWKNRKKWEAIIITEEAKKLRSEQ
jgi:hypothetical protein